MSWKFPQNIFTWNTLILFDGDYSLKIMRFKIMLEVVAFVSLVLVLTSALFGYVQRGSVDPSIDSSWVEPTNQ